MHPIRVGFVLGQVSWLGGVNYFRNLFSAIESLDDAKVRPVVFAGQKSDVSAFEGMAEIVRTPMLDRHTLTWYLHKISGKLLPEQDFLLDRLFRNHDIQVAFHFGTQWRASAVPSLGWIPDFQHLYYPNFFSDKEYKGRDAQFTNIVQRCSASLLSSQDALNDLQKRYPENAKPSFILRFASSLCPNIDLLPSREELAAKYSLGAHWFHLPNQFWAHKNHGVVIEALRDLKAEGIHPLVVSTGKTDDYRNSAYFPALIELAEKYGVGQQFKTLGIVPYEDVVALMFYSVAVINPSLFEGWSTSVEESKALGKKVILSDIAVHREQAPPRGEYFDPRASKDLAAKISAALQVYSEAEEHAFFEVATRQLLVSRKTFAREFQEICLATAAIR